MRVKQCGFENDTVISTLLNARNPQKKARNKTLKLSICTSSESNKALDIACSLYALHRLVNLDTSFYVKTSIENEFHTTFEVKFV